MISLDFHVKSFWLQKLATNKYNFNMTQLKQVHKKLSIEVKAQLHELPHSACEIAHRFSNFPLIEAKCCVEMRFCSSEASILTSFLCYIENMVKLEYSQLQNTLILHHISKNKSILSDYLVYKGLFLKIRVYEKKIFITNVM